MKLVFTIPPQPHSGCKSMITKTAAVHLFLEKVFAKKLPRFSSDLHHAIIRDDEAQFENTTIPALVTKWLQAPDDRHHLALEQNVAKMHTTTISSPTSIFQTNFSSPSTPQGHYGTTITPQQWMPRTPRPPRPPQSNQNRTLGGRIANISNNQRNNAPPGSSNSHQPYQAHTFLCHNCHKSGHFSRQCPEPQRNPYPRNLTASPRAPPRPNLNYYQPQRQQVHVTTQGLSYQSTLPIVDDTDDQYHVAPIHATVHEDVQDSQPDDTYYYEEPQLYTWDGYDYQPYGNEQYDTIINDDTGGHINILLAHENLMNLLVLNNKNKLAMQKNKLLHHLQKHLRISK